MSSHQILPLAYNPDSTDYFRRLAEQPGTVWLDSGEPCSYSSRYDIMAALPRESVVAAGEGSLLRYRDGAAESFDTAPLDLLAQRLKAFGFESELTEPSAPDDIPFTGGAIGYLGYEATHSHFGLSQSTDREPALPHVYFGIYDWALIQDHLQRRAYLYITTHCPNSVIDLVQQCLAVEPPTLPGFSCEAMSANTNRRDYLAAIATIKDYIRAGDCYQVNYSQRFQGNFTGSSASAYLHLRKKLPSPFSAFLSTPFGHLLSLSPERFIELNGRDIKTQPIKGTEPRGATPDTDAALAQQLRASNKNRAENLMIVDLLRNDISKVSDMFSVKVPELFGLQSFANVHHLVSTVTGKLQTGLNAIDLLKATFPGGSITGAPKKRAMEIIDELEPHSRSLYCGSVIYLSFNGRMDSNIAIRSLVQTQDKIYCWGGGGIVADSEPEMEYQESLQKVGVLLEGLRGNP